jgi:hypothetical protein
MNWATWPITIPKRSAWIYSYAHALEPDYDGTRCQFIVLTSAHDAISRLVSTTLLTLTKSLPDDKKEKQTNLH